MSFSNLFKLFSNLLKKIRPIQKPLAIYTDGSHKGRWGSWSFVIVKDNTIIYEASGRERKTNSHRMEFQAAIEALNYLPEQSFVIIHTDSRVLLNAALKKNKRPLFNSDQTIILDQLTLKHNISWKWIKAHSGIIYNERCDKLCILARNLST